MKGIATPFKKRQFNQKDEDKGLGSSGKGADHVHPRRGGLGRSRGEKGGSVLSSKKEHAFTVKAQGKNQKEKIMHNPREKKNQK